jgi:hypothetical protein
VWKNLIAFVIGGCVFAKTFSSFILFYPYAQTQSKRIILFLLLFFSSMDPLPGFPWSERLGRGRWAPHHGSRVDEGELLISLGFSCLFRLTRRVRPWATSTRRKTDFRTGRTDTPTSPKGIIKFCMSVTSQRGHLNIFFKVSNRVTRLGEFSSNGWLFFSGQLVENYRSSPHCWATFSAVTVAGYALILTERAWATSWASFFWQTHPFRSPWSPMPVFLN